MSAFAILLAATIVGQASAETTAATKSNTVRVVPRPNLDVIFDAPPEGIANASRSDMVRAVARGAQRFSDLKARPTNAGQMDSCFREETPSPLLCLLWKLRPKYEALRNADPTAAFEDVWSRAADPARPAADLALLVIYAPVLQQQRVQAIVLDLKAMAALYHRQGRTSVPDRTEQAAIQEELLDVGVLTNPPAARDVSNERDVQAFMNDLFRTTFAALLDERGLRQFGGINLRAPLGARLFVDGKTLGTVIAPNTRIRDVPAGPHVLRIEQAGYLAHEATVRVKARRATVVAPQLVIAPNRGAVIGRATLLWTGVATMVAGVAVTTATLLAEGDDRRCLVAGIDGCPPSSRYRSLGPVLGGPLGYSLFSAGAVWTLGAWLNDDDQTWPWWEFLVGAAIAGTAYGVSAAVNPPRP